jgi:formylglycine-generating enzyme required for sulfatase activity
MRWLLALLVCAGCGRPGGMPVSVDPGKMPGGAEYPDPMRPAKGPRGGLADAAIVIAIEDYTKLGDRPGARAMGAAWYRYFRDERRLEPQRVTLLRDAQVTPRRLARAIERARRQARDGALWVVVIGHISSAQPGEYGELWLADGDGRDRGSQAIAPLLGRAGHGKHDQAVVILDGCMSGGSALSGTWTPATPRYRGRARPGMTTRDARNDRERLGRRRREPSDVAIFSAGLGPGCVEMLPGARFPALSYLLLQGLRGWADRDGDGNIKAVELLAHAALLLRAASPAEPRPQPSLYGADITLARRVASTGPTLAQLRSPGAPVVEEATLLREPLAWIADPMVRFERGSFVMGCPRDDRDCERDEKPAHPVKLSRFHIDPLEVTQAEFRGCVEAGVCAPVDLRRCFVWTGEAFKRGAPLPGPITLDEHPAVCVSWFQAATYCEALGKHLPTEAEWERAAVGTTGRRYPWGAAEPRCELAHFDGCGEHTRPVGMRPAGATPEGVQDLAGNVSEWIHDWYDREAYARPWQKDPSGPASGVVRVVRGGSYYDGATTLRASYRYGLNPVSGFSTVGFRCAR